MAGIIPKFIIKIKKINILVFVFSFVKRMKENSSLSTDKLVVKDKLFNL